MKKNIRAISISISLGLIIIIFALLTTAVFAWFNGQSYFGKTMSYSKRIYIGANTSDTRNYHGIINALGELEYQYIDPLVGFEENNLVPGSHIRIRTDILNQSETSIMQVSVYLQEVTYSSSLNNYLFFGTTEPVFSKDLYKSYAQYNALSDTYTIPSIPIVANQVIQPLGTLSIYWYVNIDTDAGIQTINSFMNLGKVVVTYA